MNLSIVVQRARQLARRWGWLSVVGSRAVLTFLLRLAGFGVQRAQQLARRWGWLIALGAVAVVAFVLGLIGFSRYLIAQGEPYSWTDLVYLSVQLFILESGSVHGPDVGWQLQMARVLAPLVAAYAAVRAVLGLFFHQVQMVLPRFMEGHTIICGLGRKGSRLVAQLTERGHRVVAIENDAGNVELAHCRRLGAVVLVGSASDARLLEKACVHRAKTLIAVTGDDATNVETAVLAHDLNHQRRDEPLRCVVHVSDPGLTEMLKRQHIYIDRKDPFDLRFFNAFAIGAGVMLDDPPLLASPQQAGSRPPHLLVVGLGRLGEALLAKAAARWREIRPATIRRQWVPLRYSDLDEAVELTFLEMDVRSPDFARGAFLAPADQPAPLDAIYVCLDQDSLAMTSALALCQCPHCPQAPVVVRMSEDAGLATLFRPGSNGRGAISGVRVVGMLDVTCTLDLVLGETAAEAGG